MTIEINPFTGGSIGDPVVGGIPGSILFVDASGDLASAAQMVYASGASATHVTISTESATAKGLMVKAAVSQSANLFEVQSSASLPLTYINGSGRVGVRLNGIAPTANLHLAAGSSGTSSAPLKFNSGALLNTPEAGAFEFLTDKFYGTITSGSARKEITLNDQALSSGRIPIVTTNGRLKDSSSLAYSDSTTSPQLIITGQNAPQIRLSVTDVSGGAPSLSLYNEDSETQGLLFETDFDDGESTISSVHPITFQVNSSLLLTMNDDSLSLTDGKNIGLGITVGTKIGTDINQKIGFFNSSPVIQQNTTGTSLGFTAGAGTTVTDQSTFTGNTGSRAYRISDIVRALKNYGLLAAS